VTRIASTVRRALAAALCALAFPAFVPLAGATGATFGGWGQLHGQSLSIEVKGGVNAARHLDRADAWHHDIRSSYRYGALVGLAAVVELPRVPGRIGLQLEAVHSTKGGAEPDGSWTRLTYLELPILVRVPLDWSRAAPLRPFVNAGISPARELSCSAEARPAVWNGPQPLERVPCSEVRSYKGDLGLVLGGGARMQVRGLDAGLELRYTHGTSDLMSRFEHRERLNRSISMVAGVALPFF
jgi:hypothetical protein